LYTHLYDSEREFRRNGLLDVLHLTLPDRNVLSKPKYNKPEAIRRLKKIGQISDNFIKLIENWPDAGDAWYTIQNGEEYILLQISLPLYVRAYSRISLLPSLIYGLLLEYARRKGIFSCSEKVIDTLSPFIEKYFKMIMLPYGKRKASKVINEKIRQLSSTNIQKEIPMVFQEFDDLFSHMLDSLKGVKDKLEIEYELYKIEILFPSRYFEIDSVIKALTNSLISEVELLENKSSSGSENEKRKSYHPYNTASNLKEEVKKYL